MKTPKKLRRSVGTSSASSWIRTPLARPRRSSALPKFLAQMGAAAGRRGTAEKHRSWRGVARTSRCSLDIFSPVFQPPEGRRENSPGLQPWECVRKEKRPERAADCRALFPKNAFVESDSIQTPFEGDFVARLIPRAESLGCSVFPPSGHAKCRNSIGCRLQCPQPGGSKQFPCRNRGNYRRKSLHR